MLTLGDLQANPSRLNELGGDDALVAAAGTGEELVHGGQRAREATIVFQHETINMMKADRAEQTDKLLKLVGPKSAVLPLRKKPESLWDHITVGRASTADIVITDPAVSSVHAHFERDEEEGKLSVQDVGSSNGTFLNRTPLQPHAPAVLRSGDCIRFGQTVFYLVGNAMLKELAARK